MCFIYERIFRLISVWGHLVIESLFGGVIFSVI